jgi:hypothetical protein
LVIYRYITSAHTAERQSELNSFRLEQMFRMTLTVDPGHSREDDSWYESTPAARANSEHGPAETPGSLADLVNLFRTGFPRRGYLCHATDFKTRTCQRFSNLTQSRNPFLVLEIPTFEPHDRAEMVERHPRVIDQSNTL